MDCAQLPEIGVSEFVTNLRKKIGNRRIPFAGGVELTARCNLRCVHCYINKSADDGDALRRELTREQLCGILDQIADEGCLWLLLTGGEPLIRPDFKEVYRHAKMKGLIITLFTNGTCIDEGVADFLADWRPFSVEITLYGRTEKTYEAVTRVAGSYKRCMKGIELLLERGLPLALKSTIVSRNKHELWEMKSFAEGLGVQFRFDPVIIPRVDNKRPVEQFRITPEEVVAFDEADEGRMNEWLEFYSKFQGASPPPDRLFQCGAGMQAFHMDSEGRLIPCVMIRSRSYDLTKGAFREGWQTFFGKMINEKFQGNTLCRSCQLASVCHNCPGWVELTQGQNGHPVDYLCRITQLRSELLSAHSKTMEVQDDRAKGHENGKEEVLQTGDRQGGTCA